MGAEGKVTDPHPRHSILWEKAGVREVVGRKVISAFGLCGDVVALLRSVHQREGETHT